MHIIVLSRYLISKNSGNRVLNENFSSWDRHIPNFFPTNLPLTRRPESEDSHSNQPYALDTFKSAEEIQQDHFVCNEVNHDAIVISHKAEGSQSIKIDIYDS